MLGTSLRQPVKSVELSALRRTVGGAVHLVLEMWGQSGGPHGMSDAVTPGAPSIATRCLTLFRFHLGSIRFRCQICSVLVFSHASVCKSVAPVAQLDRASAF